MLDPAAPLPLYHQLAALLEARIEAGEYAPGAKIPSEHELAESFSVGRPTVRQATEVLVRRRILERRRGSGTFVSERGPAVDLFSLGGTLASFENEGLLLEPRLVGKPRSVHSEGLGRAALRVERLSSIDDAPVLFERIDFDAATFPDLARHVTPSTSLSGLVRNRYGLRPRGARQTFRVAVADAASERALGIAPGTPLLLVSRRLDFAGLGSVVFATLACRTDSLEFSQEISAHD